MPINDNISDFLKQYKEEHSKSMSALAEDFGIAKSALENYLNGSGNPCADTIDILAEKCGVSAAEMISAHSLGWERAEIVERAAKLFSSLPPERRERAVKLFLFSIKSILKLPGSGFSSIQYR